MSTTETTVLDVLIKLLGNPEGATQLGQTVGTMVRLGQLTPGAADLFDQKVADASMLVEGERTDLWSCYRSGRYDAQHLTGTQRQG